MTRLIIILIASLFSLNSYANKVQFTGGNYVYADNNGLTFNLSPSTFRARPWQYDKATDSVKTEFAINMPLKTRYTSDFYGVEVLNRYNFQHASLGRHAVQYDNSYIKPVYYQKAFLPAVGWAIRAGGLIRAASSVAGSVLRKCYASTACSTAAAAASAALHLCEFNLSTGMFKLPISACNAAGEEGWVLNKQGEWERISSYVLSNYGGLFSWFESGWDGMGVSLDEGKAFLEGLCTNPQNVTSGTFPNNYTAKYVSHKWSVNSGGDHFIDCYWDGSQGRAAVMKRTKTEKMDINNLERIVNKDFPKNPTPYINEGSLSAGLQGNISATKAAFESTGSPSFTLTGGETYRNPSTGQTQQDRVTIYNGQPSSNSKPSGTASQGSSGGAGNSTVTNITNITNINRGDVEATSNPPSKTNTPNNSSGSGSSGDSQPDKPKDEEKEEEKKECDENVVSCMPPGDLPEEEEFEVPTLDVSQYLKVDNFISSTGVCPQAETITLPYYGTVSIGYEPLCRLAELIRGFVMLAGVLTAAAIIFRRG